MEAVGYERRLTIHGGAATRWGHTVPSFGQWESPRQACNPRLVSRAEPTFDKVATD
jgi:hypothetical protein